MKVEKRIIDILRKKADKRLDEKKAIEKPIIEILQKVEKKFANFKKRSARVYQIGSPYLNHDIMVQVRKDPETWQARAIRIKNGWVQFGHLDWPQDVTEFTDLMRVTPFFRLSVGETSVKSPLIIERIMAYTP